MTLVPGTDLGGGCRAGVPPLLHPEMIGRLSNTTGTLQKNEKKYVHPLPRKILDVHPLLRKNLDPPLSPIMKYLPFYIVLLSVIHE